MTNIDSVLQKPQEAIRSAVANSIEDKATAQRLGKLKSRFMLKE